MRKNIIIATLLIGLAACSEDFLDRRPLGKETTDSFFNDKDKAEANFNLMLVAGYEFFNFAEGQWGGVGHHGEFMWDMLTDDTQKGGDGPGDYSNIVNPGWRAWNTMPSASGPAGSAYIAYNVGKERANSILQYVAKYKDALTPDAYNRIKGEALFLRAYCYFYGVKIFGSIPYFDHTITPNEFNNPVSLSPEQLYAKIESDLTEAVSLLQEKSKWLGMYGIRPEGRATKGAARAVLAKVIAMEIGFGFNGKTWQDLYNVTKAIVESGEYTLVPNYATIFENEGMNNTESIFEVQCVDLNQGWGKPGSNMAPAFTTPRLTAGNNKGKRLSDGWGFCLPTKSLSDEFEPGDVRRKATIIESGDILWEDGDPATNEQIDISVKDKCPTLMFLRKYAAPPQYKNNTNSNNNIRLIRYSDMLLLCAEAAANLGKDDEARKYVNIVRDRARNSTLPKGSQLLNPGYPSNVSVVNLLPPVTASGTALIAAIKHERRVELAGEGHRLWDLYRWGDYEKAIAVYAAEDPLLNTTTINPAQVLANYKTHLIGGKVPCLPIPNGDVVQFGVKQNPGY